MKQVNSTDFQRHFARWQDAALTEPLAITKHDRPRLVMMSYEDYRLLARGRRQALHVSEFSEADLAGIEAAEVPEGFSHLDDEMDD